MKKCLLVVGILAFFGCKDTPKNNTENTFFTQVKIQNILTDSIGVRAIELKGDALFYAGNAGKYGYINLKDPSMKVQHKIMYDSIFPGFRSIASTPDADFILSVANPALLYQVNRAGEARLKYIEKDSAVFYDSMEFWNANEGIAIGDPTDGCLSIIITRDGGATWQKIPCENVPDAAQGEAAFAASDSNIAIVGDKTWLISGGTKSRVYYSPDKGKTWTIQDVPLIDGKSTTGGYSIDFYNERIGAVIGGDYTQMDQNKGNKAITFDGGRTWQLMADGKDPGYKSCIQFVPNGKGNEIIAVGPTGISYSKNAGKTWRQISEVGFYTLRFLNDSVAYAGGKNRISKLVFQ